MGGREPPPIPSSASAPLDNREVREMTTATRDDTEIRDDVIAELDFDPEIEPGEIGVKVQAGVVTLLGTVDSYPMRQAAAESAHKVRSVRAVANELEVKLPYQAARTDEDIAKAAVQVLAWRIQVPKDKVDVTVSDGRVTLTGEVPWQFQRQAAEGAVRPLAGVRAVVNLITLKPILTAPDVRRTIESALVRNAQTDAQHIRVEVEDRKVVLKGSVRTWAEKQDAKRAAWSTPGVTAVDDSMAIIPGLGT
jgi:osmotically-inducible protein OsmY